MSRIFDIDYKRQVLLLLPTFLRKPVLWAFLRAAVAPVERNHDLFLKNRNDNLYKLRMNGQVCYLRRMLNDAFPDANGAIRIEDGNTVGHWLFAYDKDYDPYTNYLPITDEGTIFYDKSTILEGVSGFTVVVPRALFNPNNDAKLRSLLNNYKLLSKSYIINYE